MIRFAIVEEVRDAPAMEMNSVDRVVAPAVLNIVQQCKERLKTHYGDRLEAVILFGSAARGELREESDIDLLVVLSEPLNLFQELKTLVKVIHPLQFEATHWISAKPVSEAAFAAGAFQLYRNAKEEGIVV